MRRDLVEAALGAASELLFEDVLYTHGGDAPVSVPRAIAGVEIASERFDMFGADIRGMTHVARALRSKFPLLQKGDVIDDGFAVYRVLDFEPVGDGRFEIAIALGKA